MSPENMDSNGGGEYDAFKPRNLRQRIGAFLVRHLIQGDDDVATTRDKHLSRDVTEALTDGLDTEFTSAIRRAQSLLVAVDEQRLPGFLCDDLGLGEVDPAELKAAIQRWGELCATQLAEVRADTDMGAYLGNEIEADSRMEFSARISRAEHGLRSSLYRKFKLDA